ncbi:hypothetical protein J0S82_002969, partial [Galemys pyrenaicus]
SNLHCTNFIQLQSRDSRKLLADPRDSGSAVLREKDYLKTAKEKKLHSVTFSEIPKELMFPLNQNGQHRQPLSRLLGHPQTLRSCCHPHDLERGIPMVGAADRKPQVTQCQRRPILRKSLWWSMAWPCCLAWDRNLTLMPRVNSLMSKELGLGTNLPEVQALAPTKLHKHPPPAED